MKKNFLFRSAARKGGTDWRLRALMFGFAVFVAGGLYFGYIFLSIAVELLALQTGAEVIKLPAAPIVGPVNPNPATNPRPATSSPPKAGERINVLLLGLDQRPAEAGEPSRSDTIMVATLEPRTQSAALLSIPRDLWVAIPDMDGGVIYHKVNTAHFWGQYWHYPDGKEGTDGGPELAKRTVEYNFGVPIHYYVRIDFKGFEKVVDLLGGIDIDVPRDLVDYAYPLENDAGVTTVRFAAGRQHMDGVTALRYARTRNPDSDFGRMARQRQVLMAIRDRALQLDVLPKLPQLLMTMRDAFDTDIPLDQVISLANLARGVDADHIKTYAIDNTMVRWDEPVAGALLPKQDVIGKLIAEVFFDPLLKEEAATVEIQNGTTRDGLAGATGDMLAARGFHIARVRQANTSDYAETQIYTYADKEYTVNLLASILHVGSTNIRKAQRPAGFDVDISVILGRDATAPH